MVDTEVDSLQARVDTLEQEADTEVVTEGIVDDECKGRMLDEDGGDEDEDNL